MSDLSQRASQLDTRLAEIDRKLRAIQVDLDPGRDPAPARVPPEAPKPPDPPQAPEPQDSGRGRTGPLAALLQRSARQPPPAPAPAPAPAEARAPEPGMVPPEMHAKLLSAMRDLLDAYGWTLQQLSVVSVPSPAGDPVPVALSVGPFADTAAVRAFEAELIRIPGVGAVVLRGYEGENRAMFDVQVSEPTA